MILTKFTSRIFTNEKPYYLLIQNGKGSCFQISGTESLGMLLAMIVSGLEILRECLFSLGCVYIYRIRIYLNVIMVKKNVNHAVSEINYSNIRLI